MSEEVKKDASKVYDNPAFEEETAEVPGSGQPAEVVPSADYDDVSKSNEAENLPQNGADHNKSIDSGLDAKSNESVDTDHVYRGAVEPEYAKQDDGHTYAVSMDEEEKPKHGKPEDSPEPETNCVGKVVNALSNFYTKNKRTIWIIIGIIALLLYFIYFFAAIAYNVRHYKKPLGYMPKGIKELIGITVVIVVMYIYHKTKPLYQASCSKLWERVSEMAEKQWYWLKWLVYSVIVVLIVVILFGGLKLHERPNNLISAVGLFTLCLFCFVFSRHPSRVRWRPVLWGLGLQFIFALLILRTYVGNIIFTWLGDKVTIFLAFTDAGAKFVFGEFVEDEDGNVVQKLTNFAFAVLPVVVYFSSVISVLYYLGVMQVVIKKVAWLMQFTMETTAAESLNAAGNIFIGQSEAPLMIKPYIKDMTKSELHAIMTGGFSTVAGSVLGAYIRFGVQASHLLSASVMSAPAALAISKLFYPETEESKTKTAKDVELPKGSEINVVEAASNGASQSIKLVANIAVNLIAFLAYLALVNALLTYFGGLIGVEGLTFELICSYVFRPLVFLMGVDWSDSALVAELIGMKTFLNEFIAYDRLGAYIKEEQLSARSEVIATYALCGFSNFGSVGIMIGALGAMAPERKRDLAEIGIRALVAGTVACFMTACIAGLLISDPDVARRALESLAGGTTESVLANATDTLNTTLSTL